MTDTVSAQENEPTPRVRLGVLGAGWFVSRRHLPDAKANPHIETAALCRRDPEARAKMAAHFEIPPDQAYEDWQQMLEQAPLDAVLIATPNALHYEQAKAALERGLHVLLEKPMTVRSDQARELVELAKTKGLKLAVALNPPYWAHCHRARRALRSEKMGVLESAAMFWTGSADYLFGRTPRPSDLPGIVPPTDYRADPELNGGGYFIDGGTHLVSELLWVTGLRAVRVVALMDALPADMRIAVSIQLENGAVASITSIGDSAFSQRRVRNIFGASHGSVVIINADFETTILLQGQEPQKFREADLLPVATPVGNFAEAILGQSELFSPGEHGAHVVEVVEAAYKSASTGRAVSIPSA